MNTPIPAGVVIRKATTIPPQIKIRTGNQMKYLWLYEEAVAMKPQEVLQITMPDKKAAEAARMSLLKFCKTRGETLTPPRTWQAYLAPTENAETFDLWIEVVFSTLPPPVVLPPASQNGHGDGKGGGERPDITYKSVATGTVIPRIEMKALFREKRVQPRERFVHSARGLQEVVWQGDALVLRSVEGEA
jgi:hypothetical protein